MYPRRIDPLRAAWVAALALIGCFAQASQSAADLVARGDALMQKSRETLDTRFYAIAEEAYESALRIEPENTAAMVGLAWVSNSDHRFEEGGRWAERALAMDDELPDAYALIGDIAVERGEYDEGFAQYQKALDLRPDLSSYSRAAHLLWLTGEPGRAIRLMRMAIDAGGPHSENKAWCRAQLGLMLFHGGEIAAAEKVLREALMAAPQSPHALAALGRVRLAREDYNGAIELYERSANIAPTHEALVDLPFLYEATGRPDKAHLAFHDVVSYHQHGLETRSGGHHHHHGPGQAEAGEAEREHFHHGHGASSQLALFYADQDNNLKEALREAREAYAHYPNIFAADALAWCYYRNGKFREAQEAIDEALRWNTPLADLHYHAGMIYAAVGKERQALERLSRALELNPRFHPVHAVSARETVERLAASNLGSSPDSTRTVDNSE